MKKFFLIAVSAVQTFCLTVSCDKFGERVDALEDKADKVSLIHAQLSGIEGSIIVLQDMNRAINDEIVYLNERDADLRSLIDVLNSDLDHTTGQEDRIQALETLAKDLETQISGMKAKEQTMLSDMAEINNRLLRDDETREGAKKIYATLEVQKTISSDLESLKLRMEAAKSALKAVNDVISDSLKVIEEEDRKIAAMIEELSDKMDATETELEDLIVTKVADSKASVESWVEDLLGGYYTAGETEAKINALKEDWVEILEESDSIHRKEIEDMETGINPLPAELDTAMAKLKRAYMRYIENALDTLDEKISLDSAEIVKANASVDSLDARVNDIKARLEELKPRVEVLMYMVQSVTFVPEYQGGVAVVGCTVNSDGDTTSFDAEFSIKYQIMPDSLASKVGKSDGIPAKIGIRITSRRNTAASVTWNPVNSSDITNADGVITVKVTLSDDMKAALRDRDGGVSVCLNLDNTTITYKPGVKWKTDLSSGFTNVIAVKTN